jgi:hypothetical protein
MFDQYLFKSLRIPVMVAWVVSWNATLLLGMWVGGRGFSYESTASRVALLIALLGTSGLALSIAYSNAVQAWALRSTEDLPALKRDLWFTAVLTFLGFVSVLLSFASQTRDV